METENYSDDGTVIGIVSDVVEDFLEQDVPGSVVLIILAVVMAREIGGFWLKLRGKK